MFPGVPMINSLFWILFGVAQVLILKGAHIWFKEMNKNVKWWQTGILYSLFVVFCITVGGGFTLSGEYESQAGWYFIGILSIPTILAFAAALQLFVLRKR